MSEADAAYQQGYDRGYALGSKVAEDWRRRYIITEAMLQRLIQAQVNLELNLPKTIILPQQCPKCGLDLSQVFG